MKVFMKIIFCAAVFLSIFTFGGCTARDGYGDKSLKIPAHSDVMVIENKNNGGNIFDIKGDRLIKEKTSGNNILDLAYNVQKSVYVYLVNEGGTEKNGSRIVILHRGVKSEIKDFFAAKDIKMSPGGDKIACRVYENSSLGSAQGMKVYGLESKKYIKLKSKVLVSGNLYQWLDNHRIIYYGSMEGKKNSDAIYLYDFNKDREQVYLSDMGGYCTYFAAAGSNLLILLQNGSESNLYYYNHKTGKFQFLSDEIGQIYVSAADSKNKCIFFIGKDEGNADSVYKFSQEEIEVSRITYDFPKDVSRYGGIVQGKNGKVYFAGTGGAENGQDVFMYDPSDGSVNIISDHEGIYNIYFGRN